MTNIVKFKKEQPKIKTIEKFSPDVMEFENKEEFAEYLEKHLEELEKETTQKLNKMFSIKGYRITKIRGEISLRACSPKSNKHKSDSESEPSSKDEKENDELIKQQLKRLCELYMTLVKHLADAGIVQIAEEIEDKKF